MGRAFVAIRDSDIAAEVIGINLTIYKTLSFAVSAFYAGIAGGLFAFVLGFFDPVTFNMLLSIYFLVMIVVGGLGSVMGSITGAAFITYLMYALFKNVREVPYVGGFLVTISQRWLSITGMDNLSAIALGLVMIGIMLFEPMGIFGVMDQNQEILEDMAFLKMGGNGQASLNHHVRFCRWNPYDGSFGKIISGNEP